MMACLLVALDKLLEVLPVGLGEMLRRTITKLIMRAVEDQAKTACGGLQLCIYLGDGIEGVTHAVVHRRQERTASVPGARADEELEEGSTAEESKSL